MSRKLNIYLMLLLTSFCLYQAPVYALEDPPYTLSRLGVMSIDDDNTNPQSIIGVVVGLRLNYSFYVEGEINVPVASTEYKNEVEQGTVKISNIAMYGAYRYVFTSDYYGKLKAGIIYEEIFRDDIISNKSTKAKGSSLSGGLGFGIVYYVNKKLVMLELEATVIEKNIVLYSVGMTYPF